MYLEAFYGVSPSVVLKLPSRQQDTQKCQRTSNFASRLARVTTRPSCAAPVTVRYHVCCQDGPFGIESIMHTNDRNVLEKAE